MQQLTPTIEELLHWYEVPERPFIRSNMVMNTAGQFIVDGHATALSGPEDLRHLSFLRTVADAVLVGANTARVDNYGLPRIRNEFSAIRSTPARLVVLSKDLQFDLNSRLFEVGEHQEPPIIISSPRVEREWGHRRSELGRFAQVWLVPGENFINDAISRMREIGLNSIICEGGPAVLNAMRQENLIDEYCLTLSMAHSSTTFGDALVDLNESLHEFQLTHSHLASEFLFTKFSRRSQHE